MTQAGSCMEFHCKELCWQWWCCFRRHQFEWRTSGRSPFARKRRVAYYPLLQQGDGIWGCLVHEEDLGVYVQRARQGHLHGRLCAWCGWPGGFLGALSVHAPATTAHSDADDERAWLPVALDGMTLIYVNSYFNRDVQMKCPKTFSFFQSAGETVAPIFCLGRAGGRMGPQTNKQTI